MLAQGDAAQVRTALLGYKTASQLWLECHLPYQTLSFSLSLSLSLSPPFSLFLTLATLVAPAHFVQCVPSRTHSWNCGPAVTVHCSWRPPAYRETATASLCSPFRGAGGGSRFDSGHLIRSQIFAGDECDKYVTAAGANAVVGVEISGAGYMSLIHAATSSLGDTPLFVSEAKPALSAFFAHTESKLRI